MKTQRKVTANLELEDLARWLKKPGRRLVVQYVKHKRDYYFTADLEEDGELVVAGISEYVRHAILDAVITAYDEHP